jgi:hypothetical protein
MRTNKLLGMILVCGLILGNVAYGNQAGASKGSSPKAYSVSAEAIATRDIGPLRCTLLSVMPIRDQKPKRIRGMCEAPDLSGMLPSMPGEEEVEKKQNQVVVAMACSFELANLDRSNTVSLACNGRSFSSGSLKFSPRGSLTDFSGVVWNLGTIRGLSTVTGGYDENPGNICYVLRNGKQTDNVSDYFHRKGYWYGSFTTIAPGQKKRVTLYFSCLNDNNTMRGAGTVPSTFSLETELVMGIHDATASDDVKQIEWKLENLVIDQVITQGN